MLHDPVLLLIALIACHLYFDYSGQGQFMSDAKNPYKPIPGVPAWLVMASHAFIHAAYVTFLTGYVSLGVIEFCTHFVIDTTKCKGNISFKTDQYLHVGLKIFYVILVMIATHHIEINP